MWSSKTLYSEDLALTSVALFIFGWKFALTKLLSVCFQLCVLCCCWFLFQIQCWISVLSPSRLSLQSHTSHLSFFLVDKAQHRPSLPRRSPSPIPPVRLGLPRRNHGGDEDEVPLSEKGEASPGTVAPLLVCHSGRGCHLQPGVHPQDRAPQEGRGTFQVLHATVGLLCFVIPKYCGLWLFFYMSY